MFDGLDLNLNLHRRKRQSRDSKRSPNRTMVRNAFLQLLHTVIERGINIDLKYFDPPAWRCAWRCSEIPLGYIPHVVTSPQPPTTSNFHRPYIRRHPLNIWTQSQRLAYSSSIFEISISCNHDVLSYLHQRRRCWSKAQRSMPLLPSGRAWKYRQMCRPRRVDRDW